MFFVGAGSASATVLCKTEGTGSPSGTTCPEGWAYPAGTEIHAVLDPGTGNSKLVTAFKTMECEGSTIAGETTAEEGEPLTINVTVFVFEKCNCEVVTLAGGSLSVVWNSGTENGTLRSTGAEITTECKGTLFGNVHCIYRTSATDIGVLTGGNPATMDIEKSNIPRLTTDSLCSEKAEWSAKYEVTSPKPLFVAGHT